MVYAALHSYAEGNYFLCLSKESNQKKIHHAQKHVDFALAHPDHTNCHAKSCVHTGRGLPNALLKNFIFRS